MYPRLNQCTRERLGLDSPAPPPFSPLPQDLASSVRRGEHCHMHAPDAQVCWNGRPVCEGWERGTLEDLEKPSVADAVLRY